MRFTGTADYVATSDLTTAVNAAIVLERPLLVNGELNPDAAWTYANPKPEADMVRGRVAFWKGVKVAD